MNKRSKYFIFTLGCQMNISDSQRIATKLEESGYESAPEREADLVVVNACSVRQTAVDRIWGKIKIWQGEEKKIFLTGCVLPADRKKFQDKDIVFFNIQKLNQLNHLLSRYSHTTEYESISQYNYFGITPKNTGKIAYIPIMTGCDNFCSYCAVPYTRGHEVSRPLSNILDEVRGAVRGGAKEILLLGQNVNSYKIESFYYKGSSLENVKVTELKEWTLEVGNNGFITLLKTIDNLPGDFKFNFISSNPHDMSDELVECFVGLKKWSKELHLPLQSGDDEILRKMKRKYTSAQYLELVSVLKSQVSNLLLSTDIIVGFPGETKKQFNNTVALCKKIGFSKAYIAQYSPRPGTAAARLKDDAPKEEKKRRWLILEHLINQN